MGSATHFHSNATRAPIANPPNSAQLGASRTTSAKLHPGPCNSVGMRPRIDRQTDRQTQRRAAHPRLQDRVIPTHTPSLLMLRHSRVVHSRVVHPCFFVLRCPLSRCPPLLLRADLSTPALSTLAISAPPFFNRKKFVKFEFSIYDPKNLPAIFLYHMKGLSFQSNVIFRSVVQQLTRFQLT